MTKFSEIDGSEINSEIEKALNKAINMLNLDDEIVFKEIKIQRKDDKDCKRIECSRDQDGNMVCEWVDC